ncbi:MAG: serine hydrolase domain-containing protein, partial [Thermaurantiacus sp.]
MTRWLFLLCALAMVVAARAGAQAPRTPPQPIVPQDVVAFLDQAVSEAMARDNVAGVVASVVIDGKPAIHRGWGKAALDPTRHMDGEQTLVRIGSIGKVMTWILVLQQAEEGRLDLDADINTQLRADIRVAPGPGRAVTLRDLMAHRGGFEDRAFGHLFANSAADVLPPERWVMTRQPARVRPAGTASSYSNFATALAGVAAVHASGTRDYPTRIETRLVQPHGMTSSTARAPDPPPADRPAP